MKNIYIEIAKRTEQAILFGKSVDYSNLGITKEQEKLLEAFYEKSQKEIKDKK